jgi:uncharacterized membrane protein
MMGWNMDKPNVEELQEKSYEGRIERLVKNFESNIKSQLDIEFKESTTWSDKLADKIAEFGGSWKFINGLLIALLLWIIVNTLTITKVIHFDQFPFILLNLAFSFLAGFQAPVILMSQNRQSKRDKHESIVDFAINFRAEQEISDIQRHLHRLEENLAKGMSDVNTELAEIKKMIIDQKK